MNKIAICFLVLTTIIIQGCVHSAPAGHSVIPTEFGFDEKYLGRMNYDKLCRSSPIRWMGTAKAMEKLAGPGTFNRFYEEIKKACAKRQRSRLVRIRQHRVSFQWGVSGYGGSNAGYTSRHRHHKPRLPRTIFPTPTW